MRLLVSGICGFVGSVLAYRLAETIAGLEIVGIDNLSRPGNGINVPFLKKRGITVFHGDIRCASDLEAMPPADWVIDAASNPCIPCSPAGPDGKPGSRQLVEHNLFGTVNLLEFCKRHGAGFILIGTSRVYSSAALAGLRMRVRDDAFEPDPGQVFPAGSSPAGVSEEFSTAAPISLYGATKLSSEALALEYGAAFRFPVWINRCGVLAGAGQFGRPDQGIFSFWINSFLRKRLLKYIGFSGTGHQVRDVLHPADLVPLLCAQMIRSGPAGATLNLGGGVRNAISLAQLTQWCARRFGEREIGHLQEDRPFDPPWLVIDSALAQRTFGWQPSTSLETILSGIAEHADRHPEWLELSH